MRALLYSFVVLAGCADPLVTADVEQTSTVSNGRSLNGRSLNGRSLNGRSLNGVSLNGVTLNGRSLNGVTLSGTEIVGSEGFAGVDVVGSELTGFLSDGETIALRIDDAFTLAAPNADVWAYEVSYLADGMWTSLCGDDAAVPLAGTWSDADGSWSDGSEFTFACRGYALAKCAELGYKPWSSHTGVSLRDHHQACTRMLRADYCGDGTPGTFDGWGLDISDNLGIQRPTEGLGWSFEAKWAADGAMCMSSYRALDLIMTGDVPSCVAARISESCPESEMSGSLLQSSYDPWGVNAALANAYATYPGSKKTLSEAMVLIEQALAYLARTPARPRDAAQKVEQANTKIESAINKDLPAAFAMDLMRRYTLLVRSILVNEMSKAPATKNLATARKNLREGDAAMVQQDYPKATKRFKDGIGSL